MKKSILIAITALSALAWGAEEVKTYADGKGQVQEDGWVLLCYGADWDELYGERWMRRQTAISSACGGALLLYVPVYQNPTEEQKQELEQKLEGCPLGEHPYPSLPCALLLDSDGLPYASVSGADFIERAPALIRNAQSQLRTRCTLLRQAEREEGSDRAQTLGRIWRLSITPPKNLPDMMREADPDNASGLKDISPFDPWALAERIRALPWEKAIAELDRIQQAPLAAEERQAVLAIRMGCIRYHLGIAGAKEIARLSSTCRDLGPGMPLAKAAVRASLVWGDKLDITSGWTAGSLPRIAQDCELSGIGDLNGVGDYQVSVVSTDGPDPVRVTGIALYDGTTKVSEDRHECSVRAGVAPVNNTYSLYTSKALVDPRIVVSFDQRGRNDTSGRFGFYYINDSGVTEAIVTIPTDTRSAANLQPSQSAAAAAALATPSLDDTDPSAPSGGDADSSAPSESDADSLDTPSLDTPSLDTPSLDTPALDTSSFGFPSLDTSSGGGASESDTADGQP